MHYTLKDHQGSLTATVCGNTVERLSYDAWGNLRNPETWRTWSGVPTPMFDRGFTGHEHLYAFGLINMNGRMYDPQMSSFLSVDAYVQSPENAQGFNRYAYCLNNPLRYTDPSGWLPLGPMPGNPFHDNWSRSFVEPVYEWRDICDPAVRSEVASAVLASYMVGNGCSFSGFVSIGNDGKIDDINVIGRFDTGGKGLNYPISSQRGACVVTALGSTRKYWFKKTKKYGDGTKKWIEKSKEFEAVTGLGFNDTPKNIVEFIKWNDKENTYSNYEASLIPVSEVMEALQQDYAVAAGVNLVQSEDIIQNSGEKGHFANVSSASHSQNGSMITLEFIEPNGTSIMRSLMLPTAGLTNTYLPKEKFSAIVFFRYKLIVNP